MAPIERVKEMLGDSFRGDLSAHLLYGYVISAPDAFLMGRPVPFGADVGDAWQRWPADDCDAWFVWAGVGRAARLLSMMPFPLPWIGWFRRGRGWKEIHWVERNRFESALAKFPAMP